MSIVLFEYCSDKRNNLYCKYKTREHIPFASTTAALIKRKALLVVICTFFRTDFLERLCLSNAKINEGKFP